MTMHVEHAAPLDRRRGLSRAGLARVIRMVRDPVLIGGVPALYAAFVLTLSVLILDVYAYDFEGTIWEPARAVLDGESPYPEPNRASIQVGNPAVYPPVVTLLALPIALLSIAIAKAVWTVLLLASVASALMLVRVRDWRCYALALTSAPVLEGFFWGNVTSMLLVPLAVAWRWRDRPWVTGAAVGIIVAAKLFAWPLVVWFVLTRRFKAAFAATTSSVVLVLGAWAVIGFDGFGGYPALLRALNDVYATQSFSLATIAAAFGAPATAAVAFGWAVGAGLLGVAARITWRGGGDDRSFALAVAACIAATPIVWPYYAALLFVPIAVMWPRLAPAWFFGQVIYIVELLPSFSIPDPEPCCRPADVPPLVWAISHTSPKPWQALGIAALLGVVIIALVRGRMVSSAAVADGRSRPQGARTSSDQLLPAAQPAPARNSGTSDV